MQPWQTYETLARRAIEDRGFEVQDANVLFRANCPNIDLVVFSKDGAHYVQVKSSTKPAGTNSVVISGSPWTDDELYRGKPIFNKHDHYRARLVIIVDRMKDGGTEFYIAPPAELENLVRADALEFAKCPKKDGTPRSINFRKELPRPTIEQWRGAWHLLGDGC